MSIILFRCQGCGEVFRGFGAPLVHWKTDAKYGRFQCGDVKHFSTEHEQVITV